MVDLRALRLLSLVATTGSLSGAARTVGTTQQAASARLRALERDLRLDLAVRSPHGTRLTPAGLLVAGWAHDVVAAADDLDRSVALLRTDRRDNLSVAASLTIAEHLLPGWLITLSETHPDTRARVSAANSTVVVDEVRSGTVDLGLVETPDIPDDLTGMTLGHDELVLVVHPHHPWATRRRISVRLLASTPLLVREEGSGTRRTLDIALAKAGTEGAPPAAVLTSTLALRTTAAGGMAPTVLSGLAVADDIAAGRLVKITVDGLRMLRPLTAVWLGRRPTAAAAALLDAATSAGRPDGKDRGTSTDRPSHS